MKVGIIGGGIGGLATAAGLQRAGVDVAVFERYDRPAVSGSGISLFGNGMAALAALGLAGPAREMGAVPGGLGAYGETEAVAVWKVAGLLCRELLDRFFGEDAFPAGCAVVQEHLIELHHVGCGRKKSAGGHRLPLVTATDEEVARVRGCLDRLGLLVAA